MHSDLLFRTQLDENKMLLHCWAFVSCEYKSEHHMCHFIPKIQPKKYNIIVIIVLPWNQIEAPDMAHPGFQGKWSQQMFYGGKSKTIYQQIKGFVKLQ